jgi:ABC-type polysaccharide/polyol phosphate export permease
LQLFEQQRYGNKWCGTTPEDWLNIVVIIIILAMGCHLEVLLLATLVVRVREQRQAWGVAGTSPPHTVLVR